MKIGTSFSLTGGFKTYWGENCYKKLSELGFYGMDFNMSNTESVLYTADEVEIESILVNERESALDAGMEINQVHGPWRWPPKDYTPEDRAERMGKMKKSIKMTSVLGCKNWVVHPIMPFYVDDIGTEDEQKTWEYNIEFMTELLQFAKQYGVTICLENMPFIRFSLSKPQDILRFVKTINDDNFKICLDTGHVMACDAGLSLYEETKRLGEEIRVLHIHDDRYCKDAHLMPYLGTIDWKSFARALKEIEFKGVFSLETTPPAALSEPLFEQMSLLYANVAKEIVSDI